MQVDSKVLSRTAEKVLEDPLRRHEPDGFSITAIDRHAMVATMAKTPRANDVQIGGDHYRKAAIQPWDYIVANNIPYLEGNIVKYISRWRDKGGIKDLEKAKHYLEKLIEEEQKKGA